MPAMTADVIVDRVRSIVSRAPFSLVETTAWHTFDLQPTTNVDAVCRIPPPSSQSVLGGFDYAEDRRDSLQVWVARKHNQDFDLVRRTLLRDVHSLTAAIVRDAHQVSGDYAVPDEGRGHSIAMDPGKEYVTLRLTLAVNYESQL